MRIEACSLVRRKVVRGDWLAAGSDQGLVDAVSEFDEEDAGEEAFRSEAVALSAGDFDDQTLDSNSHGAQRRCL
jgi:hypothetical protein